MLPDKKILNEMEVEYPENPKDIIEYEYYNDNGEYVIDLKDGWEDPVGNNYIIETSKRMAYKILKRCTKVNSEGLNEALIDDERLDQLKRAKEYLANHPDDPDIQEVIDKIAELESKYAAPLRERLPEMLEKARDLIRASLGEETFEKNDTNPGISIANLGPHTAGQCIHSGNMYTGKIFSSEIKINQYVEDYPDDMLLALVIHEYVHSLKCCIFGGRENGGHNLYWRSIANKVCKEIGMIAGRFMNIEEIENMGSNYRSKKKSYYKIVCQHCGKEQYSYSGSADIVKHPENYTHRCPDGEEGQFRVERIMNESVLNEMKLSQIKQKSKNQDPARIAKSRNVKSTYIGMSKFGILNFKTTSESRPGGYHYQTIEFKDMTPFEEIVKSGRKVMPDDIKKQLQNQDVNIWCTDESFAYWAWAHQAYKNDFLYIDDRIPNLKKAIQAPKVNNVRLNGGACKHILSVVDYVMKPFVLLAISDDMTKYLAGTNDDKMKKQDVVTQNQYDAVANWDWSDIEEITGKSRIEIMSDISKTLQIIPNIDKGDIITDFVGEVLPNEAQGLKREIVDRIEELIDEDKKNS